MRRALLVCLFVAGMVPRLVQAQEDARDTERQFRFLLARGDELREQGATLDAKTDAEAVSQWKARARRLEGDYRRFLNAHPRHARAMVAYGDWLFDQGGEENQEESVRWWKKAIEVDPREPYAYNSLANSYGHDGRAAEALRLYAKAIELAPTEPVFRFYWATTCQLFRNESHEVYGWDKDEIFLHCLEQFRSARDLAPQDYDLSTAYAETFYQMPKPDWPKAYEAWKFCLNQPIDDRQRGFVCANLARVCVRLGRLDEANQWASKLPPGEQDSVRRSMERIIAESRKGNSSSGATGAPAVAPATATPVVAPSQRQ